MKRNHKLMEKYIKCHPSCEKCGRFIGCEVHHKIPISKGGEDDFPNYITLCFECHSKEHIKSRSELTKIGIEKAKNNVSYKAINVYDLYKILYEISSKDEHLTAIDILDIIDQMPACAWV